MNTKRHTQYWGITPEADAEFTAHMEDALDVYSRHYAPEVPVLCMDEQPVQLIEEVKQPIAATKDHPKRVDKETIKELGDRLQQRYADAGLPHRATGPEPKEDGRTFPPPYFNRCSALHHACGAVAFVHETPCGLSTAPYPQVNHDQLLDIQMLMYEELFRYAVEHPVNWMFTEKE